MMRRWFLILGVSALIVGAAGCDVLKLAADSSPRAATASAAPPSAPSVTAAPVPDLPKTGGDPAPAQPAPRGDRPAIAASNSAALTTTAALTIPGAAELTWSGAALALLTGDALMMAPLGPTGPTAAGGASDLARAAAPVSAGAHTLTSSGGAAELAWAAPASGGGEVVHLWNPLIGVEEAALPVTGTVTGMAFDDQGGQLAVATSSGQVLVYQRANGSEVSFAAPGFLSDLAFSPESSLLAGADAGALTVALLDARSGALVRSLVWDDSAAPNLQFVAFAPDWSVVALAGRETVEILDVASGQSRATLVHEDAITALDWTPLGDLLATAAAATLDGALQPAVSLWRVDGALAARLPLAAPALDLAFAPDGRALGVLLADGSLVLLAIP